MPVKNFDRVLKEADGSDYLEPAPTGEMTDDARILYEAKDGKAILKPVKFGSAINSVLKKNTAGDRLTADEFIEQWNLMQKIAAGGDIDISGKHIATLRDLIAKSKMSPFIVGQICAYLNEAQ